MAKKTHLLYLTAAFSTKASEEDARIDMTAALATKAHQSATYAKTEVEPELAITLQQLTAGDPVNPLAPPFATISPILTGKS